MRQPGPVRDFRGVLALLPGVGPGGEPLVLHQPLRRLVVAGATVAQGHADEIADELRVKDVELAPVVVLAEAPAQER